jgi:hypothetical protein
MNADVSLVGAIALLTGLLFTVHVVIVAGLIKRRPRWPALIALLAPPAAPILAHRAGLRLRAYVWAFAAIGYVVVRLAFPE